MPLTPCKHVIITDKNYYNINVEEYIKSIEREFKINFDSLPDWKKLLTRLHAIKTDCKRKLQDAKLRKVLIAHKLLIQYSRPSPFELSANLARTKNKWQNMESKNKERKKSVEFDFKVFNEDVEDKPKDLAEDIIETAHPNTEFEESQSPQHLSSQMIAIGDADLGLSTHLPPLISVNEHRKVSTLGSQVTALNFGYNKIQQFPNQSEFAEWRHLQPNTSIKCTPSEIVLAYDTLHEQTVKFTITNCSGEFMHIRFKYVTDTSSFKRVNVFPVTPSKVYPGITVTYKLIFKLLQRKKEFTSQLFFTVGRNVYADEIRTESLCIPIITKFIKARSVSVSEVVTIPPIYEWHMRNGSDYPTGKVTISVNDDRNYHMHILKREFDLTKGFKRSANVTHKTESVAENNISEIGSLTKEDLEAEAIEEETYTNQEVMLLVAQDIVENALATFIFQSTYLYLKPDTKIKIPVYFTKIECIGSHSCYYDFEFYDPETDDLVIIKKTRIFSDIIPHPIQIKPEQILDMSSSHVLYGFCEDTFVITNTHKIYPVSVKIKLSGIMKKLFRVIPMTAVVPTTSSVPFELKFCSRDRVKESEDLMHFTFQILFTGYKAIYENVPPLFYEVIAPCVTEYKKQYNEKYYKPFDNEVFKL